MTPDHLDARVFLGGLVGETVYTLAQRRPNKILAIEGDHVIVATAKSPAGEPVPITWIQDALDRLLRHGEIVIRASSTGYRGAFIGAVLARVPGAEVLTRPRRIRLSPRSGTDHSGRLGS